MLYRGQRPGWNDAGDSLARCALPKGDLGRCRNNSWKSRNASQEQNRFSVIVPATHLYLGHPSP